MKLMGSLQINFCTMNTKFQGKIFTSKKVIQLWNFCNFGIPEIITKSLVTLRFSKISLHELKGSCKCFQMRYWPHFYADPTHSNTYFLKVGKWRVLLQGTVAYLLCLDLDIVRFVFVLDRRDSFCIWKSKVTMYF